MIDTRLQKYAFVALAAAALFGVSTPLAKLLLGQFPPLGLAGLLYLGSGSGLLITRWLLRRSSSIVRAEPLPVRRDLPWLAGAILCGGVIAPVLLLWGLQGSGAAPASLLLNFEGVLTTLLAAAIFREAVAMRVWVATLLIVVAGILLSWQGGGAGGRWPVQSLAIAGACLFWALDNNLTRKASAGDPIVIALAKGLCAGSVNLVLALASGMRWPSATAVLFALLLGYASYGISLVLFIYALRNLGSARASAHFGAAPFIGAIVAVLLLGEPFTVSLLAALLIMGAATWLLLGERHGHLHLHEALEHGHSHSHDAHHQHAHDGGEGPEPHAHEHRHEPLRHAHPHMPDVHHRHRH